MYGFVPFKKMRQYREGVLRLSRDFSHSYTEPTVDVVDAVREAEGSVTCGQCHLKYHADCDCVSGLVA